MKKENHTVTMAELAQSEGGVFTSVQALRPGIPAMLFCLVIYGVDNKRKAYEV